MKTSKCGFISTIKAKLSNFLNYLKNVFRLNVLIEDLTTIKQLCSELENKNIELVKLNSLLLEKINNLESELIVEKDKVRDFLFNIEVY